MGDTFCAGFCAAIEGLCSCALACTCDMFRLWHRREADTMRAGATAFNGIGLAKLMLGYMKCRKSAGNECDGDTIRGCCVADLAVDGVDELFERSSSCGQ
jgi:hypothetical protein